jgi:hypothetical protein
VPPDIPSPASSQLTTRPAVFSTLTSTDAL